MLYIVIIVAGVLNGLQTGMNAQLNKSVGNTIMAAPIVYLAGLGAMLVAAPFLGFRFSDYSRLAATPWWAYLGGICGAVFIYAMLSSTQKVGAGVFMAITVTASVVTSVALDHFGALGIDQHPAGLWRLVGVALMLGGVGLIAAF
ncbi:MAG: DMT family transporter [Janthinobacterium lividum]